MSKHPILWSFRRCPYAMRARLAVQSAGSPVELREILLRDKPKEFLEVSASASVPALLVGGTAIDESFDIMLWALEQADPEHWLTMPKEGFDLIKECDGPFKTALDHTKYAVRYPDLNEADERAKAGEFLAQLDKKLAEFPFLFGATPTMADMAILPFVRQFANTDRSWFNDQNWGHVVRWLDEFLESAAFKSIMGKYSPWQNGQKPIWFPAIH